MVLSLYIKEAFVNNFSVLAQESQHSIKFSNILFRIYYHLLRRRDTPNHERIYIIPTLTNLGMDQRANARDLFILKFNSKSKRKIQVYKVTPRKLFA